MVREHADLLVVERLALGVEQKLDEAADRGERGAQLVGDGGHHVVLHLGQLAQPVVLLDQHLGHLALDGQQPLALGAELLALGDVVGDQPRSPRPDRRAAGLVTAMAPRRRVPSLRT